MRNQLTNTTYDYKRLLDLKFLRGKSKEMEQELLTLEYRVKKRMNLNLELELRFIVMREVLRKGLR